jgi:aspartate-semialdehyde dehydrogenase
MDAYNITIIGGSGIVAQEFLKILEERDIPTGRIRLLATHRSAGSVVHFRDQKIIVEETTPDILDKNDEIVFLTATSDLSLQIAPIAKGHGSFVVDDSSAYRMDPSVPLVIPEVNATDLEWHQGIISQPNCTTTPLVLALAPIHATNPLQHIVVSTYQALAGAGGKAIEGLRSETKAALAGKSEPSGVQPREIAFNAIPQVDVFTENGSTKEELKMLNETRKILNSPDIALSATCVRIPTFFGHALSIWAKFKNPINPLVARQQIEAMPGITILDEPETGVYPTPLDCAGIDDVLVGRIRSGNSKHELMLWAVTDSIRKGAATNVLQIIQEAAKRNLIRKS